MSITIYNRPQASHAEGRGFWEKGRGKFADLQSGEGKRSTPKKRACQIGAAQIIKKGRFSPSPLFPRTCLRKYLTTLPNPAPHDFKTLPAIVSLLALPVSARVLPIVFFIVHTGNNIATGSVLHGCSAPCARSANTSGRTL